MKFYKGQYYRYIEEDCAGMYVPGERKSGQIVQYVGICGDGKSRMHEVICPKGETMRVFEEELHEIEPLGPSPFHVFPQFQKGDVVMLLSETETGTVGSFKSLFIVQDTSLYFIKVQRVKGPGNLPIYCRADLFALIKRDRA